jgi:hypothetical protein
MTDDPTQVEETEEPRPAEAEAADVAEEPGDVTVHLRAQLILKRGGAETEHVFEFMSPAIVGRFDPGIGPIDVDLGSLDEGVYVSRKHARITCEDGTWKITDLGSSNGTFVLRDDFERVEESDLEDNSEIALGNARFIFRTTTQTQ